MFHAQTISLGAQDHFFQRIRPIFPSKIIAFHHFPPRKPQITRKPKKLSPILPKLLPLSFCLQWLASARFSIIFIQHWMMFDQFYCTEQNSLDLLLKFSTQSENNAPFTDFEFSCDSKEISATNHSINTFMDLLARPLDECTEDEEKEVMQMRKVVELQQEKMNEVIKNRKNQKNRVSVSIKRKISECTEAPNSPLRKTKAVRKEKP